MSQTVVLKVVMSCGGCSGAVQRALEKMEGVESFDIERENHKVTVKGNVDPEVVFQTVSKTGKKTCYWPVETETETKPEGEAKVDVEPKLVEAETKAI